mmetsp:Transcript_30278/g.61742  ORF Transcript_30278/g.61742 Transcript_30278/m.61742 type:complete len:85 (-) Transcript_30278:967-1221(-)
MKSSWQHFLEHIYTVSTGAKTITPRTMLCVQTKTWETSNFTRFAFCGHPIAEGPKTKILGLVHVPSILKAGKHFAHGMLKLSLK